MSTRGVIGIYERADAVTWRGVYHHFDSYPRGLGATLWNAYHQVFKGDLIAMMKLLIEDHPAGWSNINRCDLTLPPIWDDSPERYASHAPQSYTVRGEEPSIITQVSDYGWLEWAYLFNPVVPHMDVFSIDGKYLRWVTTVDLCDVEPEWDVLQSCAGALPAPGMQKLVRTLAARFGADFDTARPSEHLKLRQPHFDPLTIEKIGLNRVSVAHYYLSNGDLIPDPDLVFETRGGSWYAVEASQPYAYTRALYDTRWGGTAVMADAQTKLTRFAEQTARELRANGWLTATDADYTPAQE